MKVNRSLRILYNQTFENPLLKEDLKTYCCARKSRR